MTMPAARLTDLVLQNSPHCHAPIHPPVPPTPVPHPPMPLMLVKGLPTVLIGCLPAARLLDMTQPCMLVPCVPAGPGLVLKGSVKVLIGSLPAARLLDKTLHPSCVAPIPSPMGQIVGPCAPNVLIGG